MEQSVDMYRRLRWLEFLALFVIAPVGMALFVPPRQVLALLAVVALAGVLLLRITPGFQWRDLGARWRVFSWREVGLFCLGVALVSAVVMGAIHPERMFEILRERPALMLLIALFYPLMSALPQELVFRVLYFRRYGDLLPVSGRFWLNGAVFSLAHLMYWSVTVLALTFVGGVVFAWAYEQRGSFLLAFVLHSLGGVVLFAFGMGVYFYSGNVVRPF